MLGPPKPRRLDAPIAVSLEDLVPADNFYRHLEATLDLRFVRAWTRELDAERGRPSIDPVVFFKLQLVYLDLRGQGRSGRPPLETCTVAQMADDVTAFCRFLGLERPFAPPVDFGVAGSVPLASAALYS
jgi:hypothetical protein